MGFMLPPPLLLEHCATARRERNAQGSHDLRHRMGVAVVHQKLGLFLGEQDLEQATVSMLSVRVLQELLEGSTQLGFLSVALLSEQVDGRVQGVQ